MNIKKGLIPVLLIACLLLSVSAISASDDSNSLDNDTDALSVAEDDNLEIADDEVLSAGDGSFSDLSGEISGKTEYKLERNYTFNEGTDSGLTGGIPITDSITIDGQGHTIDAKGKARIFNINLNGQFDITMKNIIFTNGKASYGGAIYWAPDGGDGDIINCTFINNMVTGQYGGGAIYEYAGISNIVNSTFIDNYASTCALYLSSTRVYNSVFLNNGETTLFGGNIEADYNWFGNTIENYDTAPSVSTSSPLSNWYVLNITTNGANNVATLTLNNLYDGTGINPYYDYALPSVSFNIGGTNATVDKGSVVLDSAGKASFGFTVTGDMGKLTASSNGVSITKDVVNMADEGTMAALNTKITDAIDNGESEVKLYNDYFYSDSELVKNTITGSSNNGIGIATDLIIDGQGFTIDGNNKGGRIIYFRDASTNLILKNINFVNCKDGYGSALYVTCNNLEIINCTFANGTATGNPGAALYANVYGNYLIQNSTFTNNQLTANKNGGAIALYTNSGTAGDIINCTFIDNKAINYGGAILINSNAGVGGDIGNIIGCIFKGNDALLGSSLYLLTPGTYKLNNSIVLDEGCIIISINSFNIDNNWWGSTVDDYSSLNVDVRYGDNIQIPINKWLYLDVVADNENAKAIVSLNNLNDGTVYENYALPKFMLNVQATNADVNENTITLDENGQATINYEMTDKIGTLTVSYGDIELTKEIKLFVQDSFTALEKQINESEETTITLYHDYTYNSGFDDGLTKGIEITKSVTIDGNGYVIDAKGLSNIFYFSDDAATKNLILKNIVFANATGTNGAAVYFKGNRIEIINCTFINNAAEQGDAVYIANANVENRITQSKFINNTGANSVAYINLDSVDSKLKLNNSIFIGNDDTYNVKGTINVNVDYNWWGNTAENYDENIAKVDGVTLSNWLFVKIDANADKVSMASLSLNNVYDGSGNSTYSEYALPSLTFALGGSNIQIAKNSATLSNGQDTYKFAMLSTLSSLTASYNDITTTKALEYVIEDDGSFNALSDILWFADGNIELHKNYTFIEGVDSITTGISIINGITINGNGYTIDGKGKAAIFKISVDNVVLNNINFINGISAKGGAIYFSGEVLTIDNCTFFNNSASNSGGAIYAYVDDDMGSITNSKFINNSAPNAGVIYNYGYYGVVDNCIFINNTGNYLIDHQYSRTTISNLIFLNNTAGTGAIYGKSKNIWYGNTYDNYNTNIGWGSASNWLYLNIKFYESYAIVSLNNLYTRSSSSSSLISDYNLPEIILKINSTTLNLETDRITLDGNGQAIVPYTKISEDAKLTVSNEYVSLTKDVVVGDFYVLQGLVDNNDEIELDRDYTYNSEDTIAEGIVISRNITIDGKGHTIDAKEMTRIFNVQATGVTFKNIIFANGKSNLDWQSGKANDGSAIYYNVDNAEPVEFNVINCTFVNNTAIKDITSASYSGAAIYIKSNDGSYNIEDCTFTNNYANNKGGAIYINTNNAEFNLYNSTFIGNKAYNDGALYIETDATDITIDKCLFRENSPTSTYYSSDGNAIIWKTSNDSGNSVVKNSVFLDNGNQKNNGMYTFLLSSGTVNIDGNWWGTTAQNHPETFGSSFVGGGLTPNTWLFINSTVSSDSLLYNETATIKYFLQLHDGVDVSEFDNLKLPDFTLDVTCDKGELDKDIVSLNEEFTFRATGAGAPEVDIYCNGIEYPIYFKNIYMVPICDVPFIIYANQGLSKNKFIKTANGYYSHVTVTCNDSSLISLGNNYDVAGKTIEGTAKLTFSYDGYYSAYPNAESLDIVVKVVKVPLTINVTNIESNEITLNVTDTMDLDIAFIIDEIHKGYAPAWNTMDVDYDRNIISFDYDTGLRPDNGSYYPTGHIVAIKGGTTNLTIYCTSDKFTSENYTITITVNKIPTSVAINGETSFKVDDTSNVNAEFYVNGTLNTQAQLIYESSDEDVIKFISSTGDFKAIGNGTAVLTVRFAGNSTHENSSRTLTVTVTKYDTEITVTSDKELSLKVDEQSQILASLTSQGSPLTGTLYYISSNESVATVDSDGLITAVGEGSAVITVKYDGNYRYSNSSDSVTVSVSKIESSITLNSQNPLQISVFDEIQIDALLSHEGALTYLSSNPDVVEVNQTTGRITAKAGGSANITISYAGDNKYAKAEDVNLTVIVDKLPSHITVDDTISVDVNANGNIVATVDNGRTLRYLSTNPGIVTVDEATGVITGVIGGVANVTVIFDEDDQYLADEANVTVTVNKLQSTFTIENPVITMDVYGSVMINADSNSDGDLVYFSCNTLIATVEGNNLTALKGGKVNVTVSVAETDKYLANETNVTVTVNKLQSTIVVDDAISVDVGGTNAILASVDENRQLRYVSTNTVIVTVDEATGVITGVIGGTANVTVIFDEDDQYLGSQSNVTVTVNKLHSTFTIENSTISVDVYGNALIDITSNNDGSLSFASCDDTIVTVDGNKVTALKGGIVNVTVSVAETDRYLSNETNVTVTVNKLQSTIVVDDAISVDVDGTNAIVASVNENRQLHYLSTNTAIVTVDEATGVITGVTGGTANVAVIFDEDDQYLGSETNVTVTVNKLQSTFTIENPVITMDVYGNVLIIASSNSDGSLVFASCDSTIASVNGNNVTALKGGKVNVTLSVAETDRYLANETNVTVTVNKLQSTITVYDAISVDVDESKSLGASVNENRQLRYVSTNGNIVTVDEYTGMITGITGGTANVTVIFDEDDQYLGSKANVTVTVNKLQSTFTIENPTISVDVYGNAAIEVTSNNDGSLTFTSCDVTIVTMDGNTATGLKGGIANVTVSVTETARFLANETNVTVTVNKIRPTIDVADTIFVDVYETKSMDASVSENRQLYYSSTNSSIVTVNADGEITGIIGGVAKVAVSFHEDDQYLADEVNVTVIVNKLPSIFTNGPMSLSVDENATINSTLNHDGSVHYEFDQTKLNVTEDGLVIALVGGVHTITVIFDGNERYLENASTVTVTVSKLPADYENEPINLTVFDTSNIEHLITGYDHTNSVYSSSNETVFTVDANGLITALAGGSALLNIQFPETDKYLGDSINITVNVRKLPTVFVGDSQITIKVNESKALMIGANHNRQLTYETSNSNIVTVDDNGVIKGIIGGTAIITVSYDEDGQYLANSTQVSVTVNKLPSNINVETPPIVMYVSDNATIVASTDNDAGLFFTTDSGIISLAGDGRIIGLAEGSADIVIFTFETDTHLANRTTLKVTIKKIPTEIIVEGTEIAIDVDDSKMINATLNHPEAGSLTYTSSNPEVITIDADGRITAFKGGEANITVSYGGNDKYVGAEDVIIKVIANRIKTGIQTNQSISVDVDGENSIVVLNGEGRQIHYISANSSVVTVNDDGVIMGIIGGTANVTVIFDENEKYLGEELNVTVTVNKLPSIFTNGHMTLNVDENATINSTLNHDGAVRYEFDSAKLNVTDEGLVTALAGGVHTIRVIFDGDDKYLENASSVTVTVNRLPVEYDASPISLSVFDTLNIEYIVAGYDHTSLTYRSGNETVFTVDATGLITVLAGGSSILNIQIPESDRYLADSINITVNVDKLPTTFEGDDQITVKVNETKCLVVSINHDGQLVYESSNPDIVSVDENGLVRGIIGGTAFITVRFEGNGQYLPNSTRVNVTVEKLPSSISVENQSFEMYIDDEALIVASTDNDGRLFYTTDSSFVSVTEDGKVTGVCEGVATVTVAVLETDTRLANETHVEVTVKRIPTAINVGGTEITICADDTLLINASLNPDAGNLTYTSSNPEVVTVDGNGMITALIGGKANITVSYAGNDKYLGAEDAIVSVEVTRIETIINVDIENPVEMNVFEELEISAVLNHPQAGILAYTSSDESIVFVDNQGTMMAVAGGRANITISYAGNSKYAPAQNVTVNVVVSRLPSIIIVDDAISIDVDGFKSLNAYMENGRPLTYISNNQSIALVDGYGVVYGMAGGKTNITIAFEGDSEYEGCEVNVTVTVNKLKSTIHVEDYSLTVDVGGNVEIIATTDSDAELTYSSSNSSIAAVNGIVVTGMSGGTVNVTVSVSESDKYLASEENVTVTVRKLQPVISIEDAYLVIDVDGTVGIIATTTSDAELTYVSLNPAVAGVEGNVVTGITGGTVNVTVSVAESGRYLAEEVNVTVTVNKLQSVIDIEETSFVIDVDGSVLINASTNSDADLTFVSLNPAVAGVDGNVVTGVIGGTATVTVSVAESGSYLAEEVNVTVTVNKLQSVIDIEETSLVIDVDESAIINASTNSDADLVYESSNESIATVNGNVVTGIIAGVVNVSVSVAESDRYLGKAVNVTVTVNKVQSVIAADNITMDVDESMPINASLNVDGNLRYANLNPEIVTIDETGLIKGLIGGTATITVIFDETEKYVGSEVNVTVTVNKLQSVIILESDSLVVEVEGNAIINASTNSDADMIYESLDESLVTVDSNVVSGIVGGKSIVTVSVSETDKYNAESVNVTVTVKRHDSIITVEDAEIVITVGGKKQIVASTNSDRPIIFTIGSPFISIDGAGMVTGVSNGTAEVLLNVAESDRYSANSTVVTVKVNKNPTAITVNENISLTVGDESNLNATLGHEGKLNYTSLDESIVSVDNQGNLKAIKVGNAQIIVSFDEDGQYLGDSVTVNVTVSKIDVPSNNTISVDLHDVSRTPTFSIDLPNATGSFSVIVDGKQIGPVSLKDGKADIIVPELAYGKHDVTVLYSGDDNYSPIVQNTTVSIIKPVLSKNNDVSMLYTAKASYHVRVTVAGSPVSGQYVTFKFNGRTYNVKTDSNGYATLKLPSLKPKKAAYMITATFKDITVKNKVKVTSIIKAKNLKIKKSRKVVKIKVSLKKVNGKFLKGKKLKLKIKGKTLKAKTNKKGVATFKLKKSILKKLKVGKKYRYKVIYGKDVVTKKLKVKR